MRKLKSIENSNLSAIQKMELAVRFHDNMKRISEGKTATHIDTYSYSFITTIQTDEQPRFYQASLYHSFLRVVSSFPW